MGGGVAQAWCTRERYIIGIDLLGDRVKKMNRKEHGALHWGVSIRNVGQGGAPFIPNSSRVVSTTYNISTGQVLRVFSLQRSVLVTSARF